MLLIRFIQLNKNYLLSIPRSLYYNIRLLGIRKGLRCPIFFPIPQASQSKRHLLILNALSVRACLKSASPPAISFWNKPIKAPSRLIIANWYFTDLQYLGRDAEFQSPMERRFLSAVMYGVQDVAQSCAERVLSLKTTSLWHGISHSWITTPIKLEQVSTTQQKQTKRLFASVIMYG